MLALSIGVASVLVPKDWAEHHAVLVWIAVGVLVAASAMAFVAGLRHQPEQAPASDSSVRTGDVGRDLLVVREGGIVNIGSPTAMPPPAGTNEQIVVGELPGRPPSFVERSEVKRLGDVFAGGQTVATVTALTGSRGTGKTQVAAQFAREAIDNGVPLVAWVSAETQSSLVTGLAEIADRMGVADPEGDSERSALRLRDTLTARTREAVLIFDNATDPETVRHYLPATGSTKLVITSTDQAFASMGASVPVDVFDREQSVAYLAERTGLADHDGAESVAEYLGQLPLALAQAAAVIKLQRLTYATYVERLQALPLEDMLPSDRSDGYSRGTASAIVLSVQAVQDTDTSGSTERVLTSASLLDVSGISRAVLAALVDAVSEQQLDEVLARLVESSLMVWAEDRRAIVMHRLIARAIRDQLETRHALGEQMLSSAGRLTLLLPEEGKVWGQRESSAELVRHAMAIWENAAGAAQRGVFALDEQGAVTGLAHTAVRNRLMSADLSSAVDAALSVAEVCERVFGSNHLDTLRARNNLARAYDAAGRLDIAIPIFEDTLEASERALGNEHAQTLVCRNNLAAAYKTAGELNKAIPLFKETLAACALVFGEEHPVTLTANSNLATAYDDARELDKAIPIIEQTLAVRKRVLGEEHPDTLSSYNNLASAYQTAEELDKAIPLFEETLAACAVALGEEHPDTLASRNNLAGAYRTAGQLDKAIPLLEETLAVRKRVLGEEHPDTLISGDNLGLVYMNTGHVNKAIPILEETLAVRKRVLGEEHPDTLLWREVLSGALKASEGRRS